MGHLQTILVHTTTGLSVCGCLPRVADNVPSGSLTIQGWSKVQQNAWGAATSIGF